MKTKLLVAILCGTAISSLAQNNADTTAQAKTEKPDSLKINDLVLPRFLIEVSYRNGLLNQQLSMIDLTRSYTNSLKSGRVVQDPKFTDGLSKSGDIQIGYFIDKRRHFGFGIGIMYSYQTGTLKMDSLHIEYERQSVLLYVDNSDGVKYRQIISSAAPIFEYIKTTNLTIPVTFKFMYQFKKSDLGFAIDAGGLVGVYNTNEYSPDAYFNYEAIYQTNDKHSAIVSGYITDPYPDPAKTLKYTSVKGQTQLDIDNQQGGYNVGLNKSVIPASKSVRYTKLGYGFIVQAAITFQADYNTTFNLGGYFMYQQFSNTGNENYRITDSVGHIPDLKVPNYGNYNSMIAGMSKVQASSFGFTAGIRFFLGKARGVHIDQPAN